MISFYINKRFEGSVSSVVGTFGPPISSSRDLSLLELFFEKSLSSGHGLPEDGCVQKHWSSRRNFPEEIVFGKEISRILFLLEISQL